MWSKGNIGILIKEGKYIIIKYSCKHFEEPSNFGINNGRISKLELRQEGRIVYNFDRGLDIAPQTEAAEKALAIIMYEYN